MKQNVIKSLQLGLCLTFALALYSCKDCKTKTADKAATEAPATKAECCTPDSTATKCCTADSTKCDSTAKAPCCKTDSTACKSAAEKK